MDIDGKELVKNIMTKVNEYMKVNTTTDIDGMEKEKNLMKKEN